MCGRRQCQKSIKQGKCNPDICDDVNYREIGFNAQVLPSKHNITDGLTECETDENDVSQIVWSMSMNIFDIDEKFKQPVAIDDAER